MHISKHIVETLGLINEKSKVFTDLYGTSPN